MSRLQNVRRVSVVLLLTFSSHLFCSDLENKGDKIALAKGIIRQLYPELKGRGLHFTVDDRSTLDSEGGPTAFALHVLEPVKGVSAVPENCPSFLITVGFVFPVKGDDRIYSLHTGGPTVHMSENSRLRDLINLHPEWSDKDVEQAIRKAGGDFGPWAKDALINSLPMDVLNLLLGEVRITSVNFKSRDQTQEKEGLPSAELIWSVELSSHMQGRQDLRYFATFEPINGRLISLLQLPSRVPASR